MKGTDNYITLQLTPKRHDVDICLMAANCLSIVLGEMWIGKSAIDVDD